MVNCEIVLPACARLDQVASVLGALAGHTGSWHHGRASRGWYEVQGIEIKPSVVPEMADIILDGRLTVKYHFEWRGTTGARAMLPKSTALWIALGIKLVDFYGGSVKYQDIADCGPQHVVPQQPNICPEDGPEWDDFWRRVSMLQPVSAEDIEAAREHAAYKGRDD